MFIVQFTALEPSSVCSSFLTLTSPQCFSTSYALSMCRCAPKVAFVPSLLSYNPTLLSFVLSQFMYAQEVGHISNHCRHPKPPNSTSVGLTWSGSSVCTYHQTSLHRLHTDAFGMSTCLVILCPQLTLRDSWQCVSLLLLAPCSVLVPTHLHFLTRVNYTHHLHQKRDMKLRKGPDSDYVEENQIEDTFVTQLNACCTGGNDVSN
jgi:hypothetical protein